MNNPKMGLIGVASKFEFGGERADFLLPAAAKQMTEAGIDVVNAEKVVWDVKDALDVIDQLKAAEVESICIMDVTWVSDSLKYLFSKELGVPILFWAIPYPETFSIGCIQNYANCLKSVGQKLEYVYGMPGEMDMTKVKNVAVACQLIAAVKKMRMALVGPRQTWRVAGPQDMTTEEWDFSYMFGPTIIHMEMEDAIVDYADSISDEDAKATLAALKDRTGTATSSVPADDANMIWQAKAYMATKKLFDDLGLDAIASENYPKYCGLMNVSASWCADEGLLVDTEGDISHAMIQYMMNIATQGGTCALGEIGAYSDEAGYLTVCHEGSTGGSLAEDYSKVAISASDPDNAYRGMGAFMGVPLKAMDAVTFCNMQGCEGNYQLLIGKGKTLPVSHDEWVEGGEKLVIKLQPTQSKPTEVVDTMINNGFHHHVLVKEGDIADILAIACKFMGIKVVEC